MLEDAERERAAFATNMRVPAGYDATVAVALGAIVVATAIGFASDAVVANVLSIAVPLLFLVAVGWQMRRFREMNGVWLSGWRRGSTLRATLVAVGIYTVGVVGAVVAGDAGDWWLVGLIAAVVGVGYLLASRWWMRLYRAEYGA